MTLHHPTRQPVVNTADAPGRRRLRDTVTGLVALGALLALVIGIPFVLAIVAPVHGWPTLSWTGIANALTRPDDGHLFLAALALVAWISWAVFTLSVVVEAGAVLRGIPTPRMPLLAAPQRTAASLVAAAALLLSTPTATTTPGTRTAAAVTVLHEASVATPATPQAPQTRPTPPARHPVPSPTSGAKPTPPTPVAHRTSGPHTVTVHRGDTLWSIAESHLGSGSRFREIAQLNYGRPQPDGRTLTSSHWIYPGWTLILPAAIATSPAPQHATTQQLATTEGHATKESHGHQYVVRRGDTLWDIAEDHLGDPLRYREIFHLNQGRPQADGHALTDPDEILVGWILELPPVHRPHGAPVKASTPQSTPHPVGPHVAAVPPAAPHVPRPGLSEAAPATQPSEAPSVAATGSPGAIAPRVDSADLGASGVDFSRFALGLTALAATGAIAEVTRRRRRLQAHRRPGQRLPMPDPTLAAAEANLRTSNTPITLDTLGHALAQVSELCRIKGRPLPRIHAVLVNSRGIALVVPEDADAVPPFVLASDGRWQLDTTLMAERPEAATITPYPALVSVGTVEDGILLLNLEASGTLALDGDPTQVRDVMRTIAVELATSPLSSAIALTLPEWLGDLADVADPDRVCSTSTDAGARRANARLQSVARLLEAETAPDVLAARAQGGSVDAWQPEIFITDTDVTANPWAGVAVIRGRDAANASTTEITLHPDGTATLTPMGVAFVASRLMDSDYKQILTLLGPPDPAPEGVEDSTEGFDVTPMPVAALWSRRTEVLAALPPRPNRTADDADDLEGTLPCDANDWRGIALLGRPEISGSTPSDATRRARAIELVAYLALHPGATASEIDEAIFSGKRVTHDMRNSLVGRTRTWLGANPDGNLYLPLVAGNAGYRLAPDFRCDWTDFLELARVGLGQADGGIEALTAALKLVRARPFLGVDPATYTWAEADIQEMISTIVDVAYELAVTHVESGELTAALKAVARGLLADPANESLHQIAIAAAVRRGDTKSATRFETRLRAQLEEIDPDASPANAPV
ncbi:MAG: LysM peptidoglycan-binding domain-containing protein [Frankiales bacterium]|nr:LysM peptidoglycan-binding domain-containing protein [Frankiales bacterium]